MCSGQESRCSCQTSLLATACTVLLGPAFTLSIQKRLLALLEFAPVECLAVALFTPGSSVE